MRKSYIPLAGVAVAALLSAGLSANAAPLTYQASVLANSPYVFYRLNEDSGTTADDESVNGRDGTYVGSPTFSQDGAGPLSDDAVQFGGGSTGAYLSSPSQSFGSSLGSSSLEFVLRVDDTTSPEQALFGVFNSGNNIGADVLLNSNPNDAVNGGREGKTRFFLRDLDGNGVGVAINNPTLYDGNYHQLVFTYDATLASLPTAVLGDGFAGYLDGVPQTLEISQVNGSGNPDNFADFNVDPFFASRDVRGNPGTRAGVTLDEAVLYTSVLTPVQVAANAAAAGFVVIPEPSSLALLGVAGLGLVLRRRR